MPQTQSILVNAVNEQADTPLSIYSSPPRNQGNGTLITAFTATNNATSNRSYKAYIVEEGQQPIVPQRPFRIVLWGDIDLGTGLEGQVIPPGGSLYVECNQPNSVYFTMSGKEL